MCVCLCVSLFLIFQFRFFVVVLLLELVMWFSYTICASVCLSVALVSVGLSLCESIYVSQWLFPETIIMSLHIFRLVFQNFISNSRLLNTELTMKKNIVLL